MALAGPSAQVRGGRRRLRGRFCFNNSANSEGSMGPGGSAEALGREAEPPVMLTGQKRGSRKEEHGEHPACSPQPWRECGHCGQGSLGKTRGGPRAQMCCLQAAHPGVSLAAPAGGSEWGWGEAGHRREAGFDWDLEQAELGGGARGTPTDSRSAATGSGAEAGGAVG